MVAVVIVWEPLFGKDAEVGAEDRHQQHNGKQGNRQFIPGITIEQHQPNFRDTGQGR